jgi:hypothetical protein
MLPVRALRNKPDGGNILSAALVVIASVYALALFVEWLFTY